MAKRPVVILHGWSDTSAIFKLLERFLRAKLGHENSTISLADYVSMEDEVRIDDFATAMQTACEKTRTAATKTYSLPPGAMSPHQLALGPALSPCLRSQPSSKPCLKGE